MSKWYTVENGDVTYNDEMNGADILVTSDDDGNIYLSLTFDQIKRMYDYVVDQQ